MDYVMLRGITAAAAGRRLADAGAAAHVVCEGCGQMRLALKSLCAAGVPLRQILSPYVDTVQLLDEPAAFYGARALVCCPPGQAETLRRLCQPFDLLAFSSAEDGSPQALARLLRPRGLVKKQKEYLDQARREKRDERPSRLILAVFPARALTDLYAGPTARRAWSREVLAFGEICARLAANDGGRVLCCAGGELVVEPGADEEALMARLLETYARKLAPLCGEPPRIRYLGEGAQR